MKINQIKIVLVLFLLFLLTGCGKVGISVVDGESFNNVTINTAYADTANLDAFGRLRVSQVTGTMEVKQLHDKEPLFIDEVINGSATSIFANSSVHMRTSTNGDYIIRQTFQRGYYQNGKSQLIYITFDNFEPQINIDKKVGYYTTSKTAPYTSQQDGIFLSSNSSGVYTNIYKNGTAISVVNQSNWNIDTLDGTGISGYVVNWSKSQILEIDFEWLGVGRVRYNLVIEGQVIPFHEVDNANNIQGVYMLSPNKPIRWEIRQTGAGSGYMSHICTTIGTEGGLNILGVDRSINTDGNAVSASTVGTKYVVMAIRLKQNHQDDIITLMKTNLLSITNDAYYWELHLNPTLNKNNIYTQITDSSIEYFLDNATTVTSDGVILDSGYGVQNTLSTVSVDNALRMGASIDGTSDVVALVVSPLTINMNIHGSLTYRELR